MTLLYDFAFFVISLFYLPIYLFKGKFHGGFFMRMGFLPRDLNLSSPIWVHAVSVGEAMAVKGLVQELRKSYPHKKFIISTVTSTGHKIARNMLMEGDFAVYLPLDFSFIVKKVIKKISPSLFVIAETEIWPNLITILYSSKIPVVMVNARISDRSYRGYSCLRSIIKPILNKVSFFCAQTKDDCKRLISLGVAEDKIEVTGNLKFDITLSNAAGAKEFKEILGLVGGMKLLVAGSTHPGEEEIILRSYKELKQELKDLLLVIAPRHPERAKEIKKLVVGYGFDPLLISEALIRGMKDEGRRTIFILDTIGQLVDYYSVADIVFVGGSLVPKGGHNILEPASFAKPIIIGPEMFNFRDIRDLFVSNHATVEVKSGEELSQTLKSILLDPQKAVNLGQNAKKLLEINRGATLRSIACIGKTFK